MRVWGKKKPSGGISIKRKFTPYPKIDIDEIEESIRQNREERLKFVRMYAEWVKRHSNKEWSSQQKVLMGNPPVEEKDM